MRESIADAHFCLAAGLVRESAVHVDARGVDCEGLRLEIFDDAEDLLQVEVIRESRHQVCDERFPEAADSVYRLEVGAFARHRAALRVLGLCLALGFPKDMHDRGERNRCVLSAGDVVLAHGIVQNRN